MGAALWAALLPGASAEASPHVVVDPGHGGPDPGATNCNVSFGGRSCLYESDVNVDISKRAAKILRAWSFRVTLTRTTDGRVNTPARDLETWNPKADGSREFSKDGKVDGRDELQARVNVANCGDAHTSCDAGHPDEADLFVSVHNNACGSCPRTGTFTYYYGPSRPGFRFAERVQAEVVDAVGSRDNGIRTADFYVTRFTRMPAVLLEGLYVDNDTEAKMLASSTVRQRIAKGVAFGVVRMAAYEATMSKAASLGRSGVDLGDRRGDETKSGAGWYTQYPWARIYWSQYTDAYVMYGGILAKYLDIGGPAVFGLPVTDEIADGPARASHLQRARIYWTSGTGAHVVYGGVLAKYLDLDGPSGVLGVPVTDELGVASGRVSRFTGGRIYWRSGIGAHGVWGPSLDTYLDYRGPAGFGFPTTDTRPIGTGTETRLEKARIYASDATGAHVVYGGILARYLDEGGPEGVLGFPTSDEYDIQGGRRSDFERGSITWERETHETEVVLGP